MGGSPPASVKSSAESTDFSFYVMVMVLKCKISKPPCRYFAEPQSEFSK